MSACRHKDLALAGRGLVADKAAEPGQARRGGGKARGMSAEMAREQANEAELVNADVDEGRQDLPRRMEQHQRASLHGKPRMPAALRTQDDGGPRDHARPQVVAGGALDQ